MGGLLCLYEACVGIYFNIMTDIRGELIDDSVRSSVTALCRVPMNIVVVGLLLTGWEWTTQFYFLAGFNAIAVLAAILIRKEGEPVPCDIEVGEKETADSREEGEKT